MENIVIIPVKLAGTSPQEKEEEDVAPDSNIPLPVFRPKFVIFPTQF